MAEYKEIFGVEKWGKTVFGLKIQVASPDYGKCDAVQSTIYRAAEMIERAIMLEVTKKDPNSAIQTQRNKELLKAFGDESIYVEEIPNEYCKDYCCAHLPWFIVTTKVGRIKIGWRKRVIMIDWKDTADHTLVSRELFKDEDTTKGDKYIHAWSIEDATRYINEIITTTHKD